MTGCLPKAQLGKHQLLCMKNSTIVYSRGIQPKGLKSTLFFTASLSLVVIIFSKVYDGDFLSAFLCLPILLVALILTANIEGVEINIDQNKVREYRITLLGKRGKWMDFKSFSKITLNQSAFTIYTANLVAGDNQTYRDNYNHFLVELVNPKDNIKLLLGEKAYYNEAKEMLKAVSAQLQLETQNIFQERLRASKKRRRR